MLKIEKATYQFLKDLRKNNNREWFNKNKNRYEDAWLNMQLFVEQTWQALSKHDNLVEETPKKMLYRIYRDVRFSKDKTPYQIHFSGGFKRATRQLRGGYYFNVCPGQSFVAGGFWMPNKEDMGLIRNAIAADDEPLRKILNSKKFKDAFGSLIGEQVKTAPKGFSKDHPAIDLLRYKQFLVRKDISDQDVQSKRFSTLVTKVFRDMRPFFNCMSEILTHDANGVPLYED